MKKKKKRTRNKPKKESKRWLSELAERTLGNGRIKLIEAEVEKDRTTLVLNLSFSFLPCPSFQSPPTPSFLTIIKYLLPVVPSHG